METAIRYFNHICTVHSRRNSLWEWIPWTIYTSYGNVYAHSDEWQRRRRWCCNEIRHYTILNQKTANSIPLPEDIYIYGVSQSSFQAQFLFILICHFHDAFCVCCMSSGCARMLATLPPNGGNENNGNGMCICVRVYAIRCVCIINKSDCAEQQRMYVGDVQRHC